MRVLLAGVISSVLLCGFAAVASAADWTPTAWTDENTVELRTTDPGTEPHWFPVWFVILDGQMYVRLGSRAAGRWDRNTTKPNVGVRIAGATFESMKGVMTPEKVDAVTAAMRDKYWTQGDIFVRYMSHPYTMRLESVTP